MVSIGSPVSLLDQLGVVPVRVIDKRVDIDRTLKWTFNQGPTLTSFQQYNANSSDTTSLSFNCNPPSMDTIVDRKFRLYFPVQLTFHGHTGTQQTSSAGSTANKLLSYGNGDAFRANPISSIISGVTLQINGGNVNLPLYDVIQPLSRFAKKSVLDQEWSCTTSFQDTYQEYYQGVAASNNPLGAYSDSTVSPLRGSFPATVVSDDGQTAVVTAELEEELYLSPCMFGDKDNEGFVGIDTMQLQIQLLSDLSRIWSHVGNSPSATGYFSTISSVDFEFTSVPQLRYVTFSPNPYVAPFNPNKAYVYDYQYIQAYSNSGNTLAPAGSATKATNTFTISNIPHALMMLCRENNNDADLTTTDTYAEITGVSVIWQNQQSLINNATQQDLYRMAKRNGYNSSWVDWKSKSGSLLLFEMASDIGLNDWESPGLPGKYTVQATITYKNNNPVRSILYEQYIIGIWTGLFVIENGRALQQIAPIRGEDVIRARNANVVEKSALSTLSGGDFFSGIKDFFTETIPSVAKQTYDVAKDVYREVKPIVSTARDVYKEVAPLLPLVGLGNSGGARSGGVYSGGRRMMRGGGKDTEETKVCEKDCGHESCDARGGCLECKGNKVPVGNMSKDELRNRLSMGAQREVDMMTEASYNPDEEYDEKYPEEANLYGGSFVNKKRSVSIKNKNKVFKETVAKKLNGDYRSLPEITYV